MSIPLPAESTSALQQHAEVLTKVVTRPRWLWRVCLATAVYLIVELAFNARLLDVVGGGASTEEIEKIEVWGRIISGFALALIFWPAIIKRADSKGFGWMKRNLSLAFWSALAIAGMYNGQEMLLNHLVDTSTPEELQTAQHLVLLQTGVSNNVAVVDSLELTQERISTPEGKATLALLPILASHVEDVGESFTSDTRLSIARNVILSAQGDPGERFEHFRSLLKALQEAYNGYYAMAAKIQATTRNRNAAKRQLQQAKIELGEALTEVMPGLYRIIPPDSPQEFLEHPAMQVIMLDTLGFTCIRSASFQPKNGEEFKAGFFDREVDCLLERHEREDGDPEAGRTARRALLVPFMALVFSLMGALAHVTKLSLYVLTLVRGYPLFKKPGRFAMVTLILPAALVTVFAWTMSSDTTSSKAFRSLEQQAGLVMRTMIRGTIHGQMVGYPIFEGVRVHLMRGFTFGYTGEESAAETDDQSEEKPA